MLTSAVQYPSEHGEGVWEKFGLAPGMNLLWQQLRGKHVHLEAASHAIRSHNITEWRESMLTGISGIVAGGFVTAKVLKRVFA